MQRVLEPRVGMGWGGGSGLLGTVLALSRPSGVTARFLLLPGLSISSAEWTVCPAVWELFGPLEGSGRGWAPEVQCSSCLGMLLLTCLLCLWCVTGPRGHTWAAWISSKYHSSQLPSVPCGSAHSVPSTWNAILLHLHDQALAPSRSRNLSLLPPTWSHPSFL